MPTTVRIAVLGEFLADLSWEKSDTNHRDKAEGQLEGAAEGAQRGSTKGEDLKKNTVRADLLEFEP